jgi:hypothetical protein
MPDIQYTPGKTSDLFDPVTGLWVGVYDRNGREQLVQLAGGGAGNGNIDGGTPDSNYTSTNPIEGGTP